MITFRIVKVLAFIATFSITSKISAQHSLSDVTKGFSQTYGWPIHASKSNARTSAIEKRGRPLLIKSYEWINETNDWDLTTTVKSTCDLSGNLLQVLRFDGLSDSLGRSFYDYHSNGQMSSLLMQWFDSNRKTWVNEFKVALDFDAHGNLTSTRTFNWIMHSKTWMVSFENTIVYDELGRTIEKIEQSAYSDLHTRTTSTYVGSEVQPVATTSYVRQGETWLPTARSSQKFVDGKWTSSIHQSWNGMNWADSSRTTITYSSDGLTGIEERFVNGVWTPKVRFTSIEDAAKKTFISEFFENGKWTTSRSTSFIDSHGNDAGHVNEIYSEGTWRIQSYSYLTHTYNSEGDVIETIEEINDDGTKSKLKTVYEDFYYPEATSISSKSNEASLLAFPVPVKDIVTVQNTFAEEGVFTLSDMVGNEISFSLEKGGSKKIDISEYPSGVYILNIVTSSGKRAFQKIIKE
ncbi:MAG TPA: T9SS type A sorting domain-containing protein [Cytophagaceae bacterium]|jgi:hypothetical protein